jgi:hypothetical protein
MKALFTCFFVCCLSLTSCVNLQSVNLFGTASAVSLQQYKTVPATFTGVYRQRVQDDSLSRHPFGKIPLVGIDFADRVRQDSIRSYVLADSLTRSGTDLLTAYFTALADLAVTGKTFVPVRLASPTVESFLQTSAVKLTPDQSASFVRMANLLGSVATGAYRRRRLAILLTQSHDDVRQLLGVLAFAYERLAAVVDISRDQQYGYYKNLFIQDRTLTYTQKQDLARQWLKTSQAIEQTRQAVLAHVKTIKTVQAGFDELYSKRNALNRKTTLMAVKNYATTLQQVRSDLDQLNAVYERFHP